MAHRQAFCWIDEWYDMTYEDIVKFERETYSKTNDKVLKNSKNNAKVDSHVNNQEFENKKIEFD